VQAPKGQTTERSDELGEAQLVAYEYEAGSRPTSTMTAESFGVTSSGYDTSASSCTSATGQLWDTVTGQLLFNALHEMQTQSSDENSVCLSVRLAVCLSVTRVIPDKMDERSVQIFIPYERTFILVF